VNRNTSNGPVIEPSPSNFAIANSVVWGNDDGDESILSNSPGTINYINSIVQDRDSISSTIHVGPEFVNSDDDNLALSCRSQAIDLGVPIAGIDIDLAGNPRVVGAAPDAGCFEFQSVPCPVVDDGIRRVSADGRFDADGLSWDSPSSALNIVMDVARPGEEIWIAAGTYRPGPEPEDTFTLWSGVEAYGGFPPDGGNCTFGARDLDVHETVLTGELDDPNDPTDNAFHVVTVRSDADFLANPLDDLLRCDSDDEGRMRPLSRLDGLTIRDGGQTGVLEPFGGGVFGDNIDDCLEIVACRLTDHRSTIGSAADVRTDARFTLRNSLVQGNISDVRFAVEVSSEPALPVELINTNFIANHALQATAFFVNRGRLHMQSCAFLHNVSDSESAAIGWILTSPPDAEHVVESCLFAHNQSAEGGLIRAFGALNLRISHSTFADNTADVPSSPVLPLSSTKLIDVSNSVIWNNHSRALADFPDAFTITNSVIEGGYPGTNVLDADPQFIDAPEGNYRLGPNSPAVDAGAFALLPMDTFDLDGDGIAEEPLSVDLDGRARFDGASVDMGAFERPACPADCMPVNAPGAPNGNGIVSIDDLLAVLNAFGTHDQTCDVNLTTGDINVDDLVEVIVSFGLCD
ncbi:MAG: choice-of-anchor Q domain-containing protein, partial [Planctomycetota bacterium]